jgi:hypothetical protein
MRIPRIIIPIILTSITALTFLIVQETPAETVELDPQGLGIQEIERLPGRSSGVSECWSGGSYRREEPGFDPNDYFQVFDHLSMQPGYVLDYVYMCDFGGGKPVVYAHGIESKGYASYREFANTNGIPIQDSYETVKGSDDYLAHVQVDDTPEGYFQLVALSIVEDQFYLYWHALYNDTQIILTQAQAWRAWKEAVRFTSSGVAEVRDPRIKRVEKRISSLDYTPRVTLTAGHAIVRVIVFTKWGGFKELTVRIDRDFPHEILQYEEDTQIWYDCLVLF